MTELVRLGLQLLAMLIVLGGASALLVRFNRRKSGQSDGPLALVATMPLEGRRVVYLVRAGRRVLVVGGSEAGLTRLADFEASELSQQNAETLPALEELAGNASAAELLQLSESPAPPRSSWRKTPAAPQVEDLDAADFAETTGSRLLSVRTEARRSRARASESDASD
jgi:flagellar biogenesis protein FliO